MGKEAKIGLSVIVVLVLCLGGVIAKRIMSPGKPQQASTVEDAKPIHDKEGKTSGARSGPQLQQPALGVPRPTVVAAKPINGQAAKSSPLDLGHWNTTKDNTRRALGDAAAASASPSYMPKSPQPYEVNPNDRYAANYPGARTGRTGEVGAAEASASDAGMAGAADAGSEPYDPMQRFENRRSTPVAGQNSSVATIKVLPPPGSTGARTGSVTPGYASRDGSREATRGTSMSNSSAERGGQADPFNHTGRKAAPTDYGAAESRYAASQGAAGYGDSGYASSGQGSGRTPSSYNYTPATSDYAAARPSPGYGSPGRFNSRFDAGYGTQSDPRRADGTYEVQPNDSYWTISQKCYGTGAYFKALAEVNRKKIPQEDQLKVGAILAAPDVEQLERQYPNLCPKPSRREVIKRGATQVSTSAHLAGSRTYVSQEGDTLYEVARSELGKASRWVEIYEINREQIGPDYNYLPAGLHLALPGNEPADAVTRRPDREPELRYQR